MANKIWVGTTGDLNTSGNWSPSGVPASGDNVYFPAGSPSVTGSLDALKTATLGGALGSVEFEDGYTGTVGTSSSYMQFTCTSLKFSGTGQAWLNLEASAISPEIRKTATPASASSRGLYLNGSALATLSVAGNASVGVAAYGAETSTVTTARIVSASASLLLGSGVTVTTVQITAGQAEIRCGGTTLDIQGGTVTTYGSGTWTTITVDAGTLYPYSTGTITTLNQNGGTIDRLTAGQAITVTTMNHFGGVFRYDENVTTVSTYNRKDGPSQITVSDP